MKYRATSYSLGAVVGQVTVEASSHATVLRHPKVRALPAAGQGPRGKVQVIGIKLVRS